MTHENGNASADRPPFFSGLHRHLPLIDILEFPRHHRELGAGDSRDLTDHLVDEAQKLLGVARVYLNTEVALTDGNSTSCAATSCNLPGATSMRTSPMTVKPTA